MGSYANSCLAPEGINAFSAIANTLDINKRVVYLRDGAGRVLARQLLAISETPELVCFDIYYRDDGETLTFASEVRPLFAAGVAPGGG